MQRREKQKDPYCNQNRRHAWHRTASFFFAFLLPAGPMPRENSKTGRRIAAGLHQV
jgi:hypothetical protein